MRRGSKNSREEQEEEERQDEEQREEQEMQKPAEEEEEDLDSSLMSVFRADNTLAEPMVCSTMTIMPRAMSSFGASY